MDGRRARRDRGRQAVIEAVLDLLEEGGAPPLADDVADAGRRLLGHALPLLRDARRAAARGDQPLLRAQGRAVRGAADRRRPARRPRRPLRRGPRRALREDRAHRPARPGPGLRPAGVRRDAPQRPPGDGRPDSAPTSPRSYRPSPRRRGTTPSPSSAPSRRSSRGTRCSRTSGARRRRSAARGAARSRPPAADSARLAERGGEGGDRPVDVGLLRAEADDRDAHGEAAVPRRRAHPALAARLHPRRSRRAVRSSTRTTTSTWLSTHGASSSAPSSPDSFVAKRSASAQPRSTSSSTPSRPRWRIAA